MKHLILARDKTIMAVGDNYTTPIDKDVLAIKGEERPVHNLDGALYDYNGFTHDQVTAVTQEVADNPNLYKYENGEFVQKVDLLQQEYGKGFNKGIDTVNAYTMGIDIETEDIV